MKKIYIVLTQTGTILSRFIKYYTGNQYNHVSIALDENLIEMYSFGRKNPYIAFFGGFVKEGINIGTFKRFYNTRTKVCSLEVNDEQYERVVKTIQHFKDTKSEYQFDVRGMFLAGFNKKTKKENRFYCSKFVRYVLEEANIDLNGVPEIVTPQDLEDVNGLRYVFSGYLRNYELNNANGCNIIEYKFRNPLASFFEFIREGKLGNIVIEFIKKIYVRI